MSATESATKAQASGIQSQGLSNDRQMIDVCHLGRSTCERQRVGGDSERSAEEVGMGRECLPTRECHDCRPPPTSTGNPTAGRRRRGAEDDSVCRPAFDDSPPCHYGRRNDHHARACSLASIGEGAGITISAGKRCYDSISEVSDVVATPTCWCLDKHLPRWNQEAYRLKHAHQA